MPFYFNPVNTCTLLFILMCILPQNKRKYVSLVRMRVCIWAYFFSVVGCSVTVCPSLEFHHNFFGIDNGTFTDGFSSVSDYLCFFGGRMSSFANVR